MADDITLNPGVGGAKVRAIDRANAGIETQVVQIDFGGGAGNAEQLVTGNNPLPVQPAYLPPAAWDGSAIDMRRYSNVILTVTTAVTAARTPEWSPNGLTNWSSMTLIDGNAGFLASIGTSFTGPAQFFIGNGFMRLNGGSGGAFMISGSN